MNGRVLSYRRRACFCAIVVLGCLVGNARGAMLSFYCLTNNNSADAAIGVAQLTVEVTSPDASHVLFEFRNIGPAASSIADVYWDDGSLLTLDNLVDEDDGFGGDAGVDFSPGASPGNLPGGNNASPAFVATEGFLIDSDPPVRPSGVDPGERLGVLYTLQAGASLQDIIDELVTGTMRVGLHVQGFDSGGSESFINNPLVANIPEPATMSLLALGASLSLFRRKRR